jgi:uroporphyrinogen III methyltransferase/synthase
VSDDTRAMRPLEGRSVIVTRTRDQAAALAEPLETLGAEVVAFPVIEIAPPQDWAPVDEAARRIEDYDWVVFTSANAVAEFLNRASAVTGDDPVHVLAKPWVAAVGKSTARTLELVGVQVDLVPEDAHAEGLAVAFDELGAGPGWKVLIPRAEHAREVLPEALRTAGADVDVVTVYRTVAAEPDPAVVERLRGGGIDAVTFTSGSTVRHFVDRLTDAGLDPAAQMERLVVASIGPVTTSALEKRGFAADVEAAEATVESLAAALAAHFIS